MGTDSGHRRRAVFLDRDGVINSNLWNPETGQMESPLRAGQFCFLPGTLTAIQALHRAGFLIFLVSNQPNYAKGKASLEELDAIHQRLLLGLEEIGVALSASYYCLHHPSGITPGYSGPCVCRKPSPFFLEQAITEFQLSRKDSWMVGDRLTDIECGQRAGVRTILIAAETVLDTGGASAVDPNLSRAVDRILERSSQAVGSDGIGMR